ncbi:MAG: aldo/keto reductase [Gemmataceae bacterium]
MQQTELGTTGLTVSRIGLGLAALGRPGYMNLGHADDLEHNYDIAAMELHAHAVLDAAWACGVRYFDAARSYGKAEQFLANWLRARHVKPDSVTVGSKWGYTYTAGWQVQAAKHEVKDHSLAVLKRQYAESEALLGRYLGLYQVHSATLDSGLLDNQEALGELARLKETGLRIGLTLTGTGQAGALKRALEIEFHNQRLFDVVQATWNLLEPSAGPALQEAHQAGMGVIIKEALANGRLTSRNTDPDFHAKRKALGDAANRLQTTIDALALAAALAQPWADVVLSGAATTAHLSSNLAACNVRWTAEIADTLHFLEEQPHEYWAHRSRLAWN